MAVFVGEDAFAEEAASRAQRKKAAKGPFVIVIIIVQQKREKKERIDDVAGPKKDGKRGWIVGRNGTVVVVGGDGRR